MESPPGLQKALVSQGFEDFYACSKRWAGHLRATSWFTFEHPGLPLGLDAICARRARLRQVMGGARLKMPSVYRAAEGSSLSGPASRTTTEGALSIGGSHHVSTRFRYNRQYLAPFWAANSATRSPFSTTATSSAGMNR